MKLSVVLSFYRSIPMLIRELCKKNSVAHRFHRFQITLLLSLVNIRNGSRRGSNHCLLEYVVVVSPEVAAARRESEPMQGLDLLPTSHDHRDPYHMSIQAYLVVNHIHPWTSCLFVSYSLIFL